MHAAATRTTRQGVRRQLVWGPVGGCAEREPRGAVVSGPFDIVLFEGWRVGVQRGSLHGSAFDYRRASAAIRQKP